MYVIPASVTPVVALKIVKVPVPVFAAAADCRATFRLFPLEMDIAVEYPANVPLPFRAYLMKAVLPVVLLKYIETEIG
jgi:hypothetical protein